ncbi:MAG: cytochrome C oxidase subunit IV family protein [Actinomycetota bacterium]|nr:cytochrome C oxidase subunit IV family protein [Actinomycetota bacterium]
MDDNSPGAAEAAAATAPASPAVTSGDVNLQRTGVAGVAPPVEDVHAELAHPDPRKYVGVALILAVVTGVEVGLYYTTLTGLVLVSLLLGLAVVKFGMVAAYFMHLKFDGRLLRRLFVTGIVLALGVYSVALFTMDVLLH